MNHQVNFENALALLHANIQHLLRLHGHTVNTANIFDISPLFNTMLPQNKHYLGRCFQVMDPVDNDFNDENVQHKFEVL
jgi:hypothetical protein